MHWVLLISAAMRARRHGADSVISVFGGYRPYARGTATEVKRLMVRAGRSEAPGTRGGIHPARNIDCVPETPTPTVTSAHGRGAGHERGGVGALPRQRLLPPRRRRGSSGL